MRHQARLIKFGDNKAEGNILGPLTDPARDIFKN